MCNKKCSECENLCSDNYNGYKCSEYHVEIKDPDTDNCGWGYRYSENDRYGRNRKEQIDEENRSSSWW